MYGYTLHVSDPLEVYLAVHQAVQDVAAEEGGGDGLVLHLAYPTDRGFDVIEVWESKEQYDAFNRDVFPKAVARAGLPLEEPALEPVEFSPAGVMVPRAVRFPTP